jgi:hydrogenase expression/formation protein HypE
MSEDRSNQNHPDEFALCCPAPLGDHPTVQLAHGGGGRLMRALIEGLFLPVFQSPRPCAATNSDAPANLPPLFGMGAAQSRSFPVPHDSAVVEIAGVRLAFTTDTFVVSPLQFPGGDIGKLAVCGTVNDLAMAGAKPLYLSAAFVLEEGLSMETLRQIVASMRETADAAGVQIVTGDTKVVDRGKGDGIYINTAGIGLVPDGLEISPRRVAPGDVVLLSGDLGRHGDRRFVQLHANPGVGGDFVQGGCQTAPR